MRLQELVGKKAIRTRPVFYNVYGDSIDTSHMELEEVMSHYFENEYEDQDDSYYIDKGDYITVTRVDVEGVHYIQHFGPNIGENTFDYNNKVDKGFLDNHWKEVKDV